MGEQIKILSLTRSVSNLLSDLADVILLLRQIVKIPDTLWGGDEPREACFEMRRLAIQALFKLGAETSDMSDQNKADQATETTPTNKTGDDFDKTYYEIRLGVYCKNYSNSKTFHDWMFKHSGRIEMCGPIPDIGDHREYGHCTIRIPVEKEFFETVLKKFDEAKEYHA